MIKPFTPARNPEKTIRVDHDEKWGADKQPTHSALPFADVATFTIHNNTTFFGKEKKKKLTIANSIRYSIARLCLKLATPEIW